MSEKIITLNEEAVKTELKDLVRKSVEETLNELLDSEAEELTGAASMNATNPEKATAAGTIPETLPPRQAM